MASVIELERAMVQSVRPWRDRQDEAWSVADEQLRLWRAQGLTNAEIFAELQYGEALRDCSRDDIVCLIAARWLGVAG